MLSWGYYSCDNIFFKVGFVHYLLLREFWWIIYCLKKLQLISACQIFIITQLSCVKTFIIAVQNWYNFLGKTPVWHFGIIWWPPLSFIVRHKVRQSWERFDLKSPNFIQMSIPVVSTRLKPHLIWRHWPLSVGSYWRLNKKPTIRWD